MRKVTVKELEIVIAVYGPQGIGKTKIAKEIADKYAPCGSRRVQIFSTNEKKAMHVLRTGLESSLGFVQEVPG